MKLFQMVLTLSLFVLLMPMLTRAQDNEKPYGKRGGLASMLEDADQDGDSALSWEEFLAAHEKRLEKRFSRMDQNQDGVLQKDELQNARRRGRGRMRGRN